MRVLVVEDEKRILSFVKKGLEEQGFTVEASSDGDEALELLTHEPFDACVLDIMLPGRDGLSVVKTLRRRGRQIPVILLTARNELEDRVEGLNLGADDYLPKPFFVEELIARLQAVIRRSHGEIQELLKAGPLVLDRLTRKVRRGEEEIELTSREYNLLEYLMRNPERIRTRTQILEHVWGYAFDPQTNIVDACVQRVRRKIDQSGEPSRIEAVRGVGYRLRAEQNDG